MIAYSPKEYFQSKWNAFDCLVLIVGGTELILLEVEHPILFTLRSYKLVINFIYAFFLKKLMYYCKIWQIIILVFFMVSEFICILFY